MGNSMMAMAQKTEKRTWPIKKRMKKEKVENPVELVEKSQVWAAMENKATLSITYQNRPGRKVI